MNVKNLRYFILVNPQVKFAFVIVDSLAIWFNWNSVMRRLTMSMSMVNQLLSTPGLYLWISNASGHLSLSDSIGLVTSDPVHVSDGSCAVYPRARSVGWHLSLSDPLGPVSCDIWPCPRLWRVLCCLPEGQVCGLAVPEHREGPVWDDGRSAPAWGPLTSPQGHGHCRGLIRPVKRARIDTL